MLYAGRKHHRGIDFQPTGSGVIGILAGIQGLRATASRPDCTNKSIIDTSTRALPSTTSPNCLGSWGPAIACSRRVSTGSSGVFVCTGFGLPYLDGWCSGSWGTCEWITCNPRVFGFQCIVHYKGLFGLASSYCASTAHSTHHDHDHHASRSPVLKPCMVVCLT